MDYKLEKEYKVIQDSIHNGIYISNLACDIIDTSEFQRLRELHQLGTCHFVFPCGNHTRFEHSLGVYFLAGKMLETIRNNSNAEELGKYIMEIPELADTEPHNKLTDYVIELVKIAGLCHDLGHGPFSHVFDDTFLQTCTHPLEKHENRSGFILQHIVKEKKLPIKDKELKFIQNIINPEKSHTGFIYQIVSNNLNGIDVDKFDYISRDTHALNFKFGFDHSRFIDGAMVIDNKICFPKQMNFELYSLFTGRYRMHKQVYTHKAVISIQYMINDILLALDEPLKIRESVHDVSKFCELTDAYIMAYLKINKKSSNTKIKEALNIFERIQARDLYKFIGIIIYKVNPCSDSEIDKLNTKITIEDFVKTDPNIRKEDIVIHRTKIGYISGNKSNPLDNIYFYDHKDKDILNGKVERKPTCFKMDKKDISTLIPDSYQEYITMIYSRNNDLDNLKRIKTAFDQIKDIVINI